MNLDWLSSDVFQWILAAGVAVGLTLVLDIVRRVIIRRFEKLAARTSNSIDDIILDVARRTKFWFLFVIGAGVGLTFVELAPRATRGVQIAFSILTGLQVGLWATTLLEGLVNRWLAREARAGVSRNTMGAVRLLGRTIIWSVLLLVVLDNAGVNITTLVAGLGIGGVAVALATQNILGDLFSSLSIVLDKPFEVGDFIVVDDFSGSVEHIGLKTTRIRALSGEQLVFSNSNLLSSRIRNYRRMNERRIELSISVAFDTDADKLPKIVALLKEVIGRQEVRFDRSHFTGFGEVGMTFQAVYYVLTPDYNAHMDIQQAIHFDLIEGLEQLEVQVASKPTRSSVRSLLESGTPKAAAGGTTSITDEGPPDR